MPSFASPDDLKTQIAERLRTIAAEDLAPWCKLGNIVFRASEVADTGGEVHVTARVRSDDVAHALEGLRGDKWHRGGETRFTSGGRSRPVRVAAVKSTATTTRSRILGLALEIRDEQSDPLSEMRINGRSAGELTELALRTALFQEPNPLSHQHLGFFAEMPDALAQLRVARVSDEIARPLAELLIVDALVGSGRAARVTEFKLGVPIRGARRLILTWEGRRRYANQSPEPRRIIGDVRL